MANIRLLGVAGRYHRSLDGPRSCRSGGAFLIGSGLEWSHPKLLEVLFRLYMRRNKA